RVVATTHYSELKAYAYEREGILNASVEFDVETLRPTYRLLIGVPGRSNAFEISRRLGMNAELIEAARGQISSDTNKVDNMIASLEKNQRQAEKDRREAETILRETEQLRSDLEGKIASLEKERDRILKEAERKAKEAVASAKQQAEEIIEELREAQKKNGTVKEHEFIDARKRLEDAAPELTKTKPSSSDKRRKTYSFRPGDEVKVQSLDQKGHIVEKLDKDEYLVQLGIMKMNVKASDLHPLQKSKQEPVHTVVSVKGSGSSVKTELDLRGKRYEEAMTDVEKYLDDALLAGYHQVSIIHGKGTGALRKGVANLLKNHSHVKSSRMGTMGEGGTGVTVVQLK
ncbi:MAG TPA: Smr/MutS family protein, partial [Bacillales bacterium]|nr:Smr/MutS family protein [Bacillales bacterium]